MSRKPRKNRPGMSRRAFLRGLGGVTLSLPFLGSLGSARAADEPPLRLVILYQTHGLFVDRWQPRLLSGAEPTAFEYSADAYQLGELASPMARHINETVFVTGIDDASNNDDPFAGNAHVRAPAHLLTGMPMLEDSVGAAGGPSIDHIISERIYGADESPARRALHVGMRAPWEICFTGERAPVDRFGHPQHVFDDLFLDLADPEDPERVKRRLRRASILDAVKQDAAILRRDLGAEDRARLDDYLERVRNIENSLQAAAYGEACEVPQINLIKSPYREAKPEVANFHPYYDFDIANDALIELTAMSLACNSTRVATFTWGQPNQWEFLTDPVTGDKLITDDWHENVVHRSWHNVDPNEGGPQTTTMLRDEARARLDHVTVWMHEQLARFIDRLKSFPEGDGTLLDNCIVLYCNEFGATHQHDNKPYMLIGGGGGRLQTGRWLRFGGEYHQRFLLSLLEPFIDPSDPIHQSFGWSDFTGQGPLTGIWS